MSSNKASQPASVFADLIGKTEAEAINELKARGFVSRVMSREGKALVGTCDLRPNRANLTILGGKLTSISVG